MKMFVYSVYDSAALVFAQPFFSAAEGVAARSFKDMVQAADGANKVAQHPEDYVLFRIGMYDDATGLLEAEVPPKQFLRAIDCVRVSQ